MLKYTDYDIVFQEVPDEVSLAIDLSNCLHRCPGCHSSQLWDDIGEELNEQSLSNILNKYRTSVTCVCFMGGDIDTQKLQELANFVRQQGYKVAWYTGATQIPSSISISNFDYIKVGPYIESLGALRSRSTNQRFFSVKNNELVDITSVFWR